jgi:hypothetical protein
MSYTPRRMPKRFLDGAPAGILDIFDNGGKTFDRYTVVYNYPDQDGRDIWLPYRGMSEHPTSPDGFGISDEFTRWELASYRDAYRRTRIRWDELPPDVQRVARDDCRMFEEGCANV